MSKETFKSFARLHPELGNYVIKSNISWQKLYELYEIYGENSSIWNSYFENRTTNQNKENTNTSDSSFKDLFNTFKKMDLDSVQKGVTNLQKTIGLLQDIGVGKTSATKAPYEARPLYKYFED